MHTDSRHHQTFQRPTTNWPFFSFQRGSPNNHFFVKRQRLDEKNHSCRASQWSYISVQKLGSAVLPAYNLKRYSTVAAVAPTVVVHARGQQTQLTCCGCTAEERGVFRGGYTCCKRRVRVWLGDALILLGLKICENFRSTPVVNRARRTHVDIPLNNTHGNAAVGLFSPQTPAVFSGCRVPSLRQTRHTKKSNPPSQTY